MASSPKIDYAAIAKQYGAIKSEPPPADPLDFSGKYNSTLSPQQQVAFNKWADQQKAKTGRDPRKDKYDYDVNGFFLAGAGTDERSHGSDQFKKPNHPTFSNESIYHGKDGYQGGEWIASPSYQGDPAGPYTTFKPSPTSNLKFRNSQELQQAFEEQESDNPGKNLLVMPPPAPPLPAGLKGTSK